MSRPPLAEHCRVCETVATCTCQDCEAARPPVPAASSAAYAQIVGGRLIRVGDGDLIEAGDW